MTDDLPLGRRSSPFAGLSAVFSWGLRRTLSGRRLLLVILLAAVVGTILGTQGIGRRTVWRDGEARTDRAWDLFEALDDELLKFVVPLVALVLVSQGFSREVNERTLVYHLVRPVSRRTLFVGRFLSGVVTAIPVAFLPVAVTVLWSKVTLPADVWLSLGATTAVAVMAIGAVYYMLAALLRFGMIAGLIYTFVIENFFGRVLGSMQTLSIMYHVRSLHHRLTDDAFSALSPEVAVQVGRTSLSDGAGPETGALHLVIERVPWDGPAEAVLVLLVVAGVALAFGAWRVSRRDFPLKD